MRIPFMRASVAAAAMLALSACNDPFGMKQVLYPAVFTPDGAGLVFTVGHLHHCFLYRAEIATGVTRRVTAAQGGCEFYPSFSPDGRRLVFTRGLHGSMKAGVVVTNADGTSPRTLLPAIADNSEAQFVPNANEIVLLRSGAFEAYSPVARPHRHKFDVFAVDLATGHVTPLTHKEYYLVNWLSVSPDGRQLLLSLFSETGDELVVSSIDSAEKPTMQIHPESFVSVTHAVWAPDGKSVIFIGGPRARPGVKFSYNLFRLTLASGETTQLTDFAEFLSGFSLSADGSKAVVLRRGAYYIVDLTTHQVTLVPVHL